MTASRLRTDLHAVVSEVAVGSDVGTVLRAVQQWVARHRHELAPGAASAELSRLMRADVARYPWTRDPETARADFLRVAGCGGSRATLAMLVTSAFWETLTVVRDEPCSRCEGDVELLWAYEEDRTFWSCRTCALTQSVDGGAMTTSAACVPPRHVVDCGAVLSLARDEALVLFAWLARERDGLRFEDQAEQRVLWDVEAMLEKQLAEPLRTDWNALLEEARARVRDSVPDST